MEDDGTHHISTAESLSDSSNSEWQYDDKTS
jgi:hypothetical protein